MLIFLGGSVSLGSMESLDASLSFLGKYLRINVRTIIHI
jgi:hypothetical protein